MKVTVKKWLSALCAGAMAVALVPAGLCALHTAPESVSAEGGGKILYYVDCGNYVQNQDGTGDLWWRQGSAIGYPSTQPTGWMTTNGISFGTAENHGEGANVLYNSVTDKPYGLDGKGGDANGTDGTGKTWGFITNDNEYAQWSLGETRTNDHAQNEVQTGFNTARFQKQDNANGQNFKYKFEVNDSSQPLAIVVGTRRVEEWGGEDNVTIWVNGVSQGEIKSKMNQDLTYYYSGVGVEESGKYYVTLEFGDDEQKELHIAWILIATGDHNVIKNDEQRPAAKFKGYAQKGSDKIYNVAPYAMPEETGTLTAEEQAKVTAAEPFTKVSLNVTTSVGTVRNAELTVIPEDVVYFVNAGGGGDDGILKPLEPYTAEKGYGREEENAKLGGETYWSDDCFDVSVLGGKKGVKDEEQGEALKLKFDLEKGKYGFTVGAYGHWGQVRTMEIKLEGENAGTLASASETATHTTVNYTVEQAEGKQTVDLEIVPQLDQTQGYMITYVLVYETEKAPEPEHTHTISPDWSSNDTQHWHEASCGQEAHRENVGDHDWDSGVVTKAATCTDKGVKTFTCTACKTTKTEDIEPDTTAHTFDTEHWTTDETNHWHAATCTHDSEKSGEEAHTFQDDTCTVCGYKKASTEDPGTTPGEGEGKDPGTTPGGTAAKPQEGDGKGDEPEEKSGCGAVAFGTFGAVLLGGAAVVLLRKRKHE